MDPHSSPYIIPNNSLHNIEKKKKTSNYKDHKHHRQNKRKRTATTTTVSTGGYNDEIKTMRANSITDKNCDSITNLLLPILTLVITINAIITVTIIITPRYHRHHHHHHRHSRCSHLMTRMAASITKICRLWERSQALPSTFLTTTVTMTLVLIYRRHQRNHVGYHLDHHRHHRHCNPCITFGIGLRIFDAHPIPHCSSFDLLIASLLIKSFASRYFGIKPT